VFKEFNDEVIALIKDGAVGVLPTDTTYGLVCAAAIPEAVSRLYALKKREKKPGTVIAVSIEQLVALGIKERYLKPVSYFWPNPISIEIPHGIIYLNQGTGRQAFRIVKESQLQKLLEQTGPLLTSSANHPGEKPAGTIDEAKHYFSDDINFYVDGGDLSSREPSTIIRIVDDEVEVIREGAVKINEKGEIE